MPWIFFAFLPLLAAIAFGLAQAWRRAPLRSDDTADGRGLHLFALALTLSVLAVSWPSSHRYRVWLYLVRDAPVALQSLAGLALALAPGVIAAEAWLDSKPSRAGNALLALATAAWTVFYATLPMHLSAPDFDDFFVVGKFIGAVEPDWLNDKPFFTVWDWAYRALEPFSRWGILERFRINGWFALVYIVATGLWVERCLDALPDTVAPRLRRPVAWLATLHLGPVVLSHTLAYELPSATAILTTSLLLERIRASSRRSAVLDALIVMAVARSLQAGAHNASSIGWLAVYAQGLMVMRARGATAGELVWAAVLAVSAASDVTHRETVALRDTARNFNPERLHDVTRYGLAPLAGLVGAAGLFHTVDAGLGGVWRWVLDAWRAPRTSHAAAASLAVGAAIYCFANQNNFGFPLPGQTAIARDKPWDYGPNHARYAMYFYPAFIALAVSLALRLRLLGLALLCVFPVAWNYAYLARFYRGSESYPPERASYHRNTRYLTAARAHLRPRPRVVAWIPIPRDHGDNFLARAAAPGIALWSVCSPTPRPPGAMLFVSAHTTSVLALERAPAALLRAPVDVVAVMSPDALDRAALTTWCARTDLHHNPREEDLPP